MRPETSPRLAPSLSTLLDANPVLPRPLWEALMTAPNSALS